MPDSLWCGLQVICDVPFGRQHALPAGGGGAEGMLTGLLKECERVCMSDASMAVLTAHPGLLRIITEASIDAGGWQVEEEHPVKLGALEGPAVVLLRRRTTTMVIKKPSSTNYHAETGGGEGQDRRDRM